MSRVLWAGTLHILWESDETVIAVTASHCETPVLGRDGMTSSAWPARIMLDTSRLRDVASLFGAMTDPATQWHAIFQALDGAAGGALEYLVTAMAVRGLGFELECNNCFDAQGKLFLWALARGPGFVLAGVFRPATPEPAKLRTCALLTRPPAQAVQAWRGSVRFPALAGAVDVECLALREVDTEVEPYPYVWPAVLDCSEMNRVCEAQMAEVQQWTVRIVHVPQEKQDAGQQLAEMAKVMAADRIVFDIPCGTPQEKSTTVLRLVGMFHPLHDYSIVGSFQVRLEQAEVNVMEVKEKEGPDSGKYL